MANPFVDQLPPCYLSFYFILTIAKLSCVRIYKAAINLSTSSSVLLQLVQKRTQTRSSSTT